MPSNKGNYSVFNMGAFASLGEKDFHGTKGRLMLGQELGLTGCEVSMNSLPAGKYTPFVHAHKMNEEFYIVISGDGAFYVDGEEFSIQEGSLVRVAPAGERAIKAGEAGLVYVCIQAQANSLTQSTENDGVLNQSKASWME